MSAEPDNISDAIKRFILEEFLPDEDPDELTADVELLSSGILDSMAAMQVLGFIEDTYGLTIEARDATEDNLNTLASISNLVSERLGSAGDP